MLIELIFFIQAENTDNPTLDDLAYVTEELNIESTQEKIDFVIRVISKPQELLSLVEKKSRDTRSSSYIIVSDQLVTIKTNGKYKRSNLLKEIESRLKHTKSFCGLIGIFPNEMPSSDSIDELSIDAFSTFKHKDIQLLREELFKVVKRIWLKSPVAYHKPQSFGPVNSIEISCITNQKQLYDSFRLRGEVYEALGYIEKKKNRKKETDSYDPISLHFIAADTENGNKTVGTLRLIVPSLPACSSYANLVPQNTHWFNEISEMPSPFSLPVFQSFLYFLPPKQQDIPQDFTFRSRDVCEISRVIVAPDYRGMGISKLLMNHAIDIAQQLRRKNIWLECAPHHIEMYEKFGFRVKDHGNGHFYKRLQRFDTWAVAMNRRLQKTANPVSSSYESSATCYHLLITKGRAENCTLRFQYFNKSVDKIKKIFERPLSNFDQDTPLKELIPSSLTNLNVEQFVKCLKQVFDDSEPNKLSFIHQNGRNHVFNTVDIKSGNRGKIETRLYQWLG